MKQVASAINIDSGLSSFRNLRRSSGEEHCHRDVVGGIDEYPDMGGHRERSF